MKKKLLYSALAFTITSVAIFSCQKADITPTNNTPASAPAQEYVKIPPIDNDGPVLGRTDECLPTEVNLMAGQTMIAGTITVTNDSSYIYVTYTTTGGWVLTQTHLYVGDCALIPVNNPGNPIPGQFPYGGTLNNVTTVTYQIPISKIPMGGCGCIAAHAVVKQLNSSGGTIQTQTGWGQGTLINMTGGNWGMKFDYCSCTTP
ncbi:MAG: hypothetical protein ABI666_13160 [Ferruginibacter sp.]